MNGTDMAGEALKVVRIAQRADKLARQVPAAFPTDSRAAGSPRAVARALARRARGIAAVLQATGAVVGDHLGIVVDCIAGAKRSVIGRAEPVPGRRTL